MADEELSRNPENFSKQLWSLKNQEKLCDAALIVNGERIPVHSVVMASSSEYFKSIFVDSEMKEITFKDVEKDAMLALIRYCYTGKIKITKKNANGVFSLAKLLSLITVFESYALSLEKKLSVLNSLSTWKIAQLGNLKKVINSSLDYSRKNFEKVSQTDEFLDLEYSEIHELLNSGMNDTTALIIYESVKKWLNHDIDSRKENMNDLLDLVDLQCLPRDFLISESTNLCQIDGRCYKKFFDALQTRAGDSKKCAPTNTLMAAGSEGLELSKSIEIFDSTVDQWVEIKGIDCKVSYFQTALINDKLMLIGGYSGGSVTTVLSYDLKTKKTETLPSLKYARYLHSVVKHKGYVFAVGGFTSAAIPYVEKWDSSTKVWTDVASMNSSRYYCESLSLGDEIYVVGGYLTSVLNSVESFNLSTNKWTNRKPMNSPRYAFGAAVIGNYIYVAGGYYTAGLVNAEKYDPKSDTWTTIQSIPSFRYYTSAGNLSGKFVVAGGYLNTGVTNSVVVYDEQNNTWTSMPNLKNPRQYFNLVEIPWTLAQRALPKKTS